MNLFKKFKLHYLPKIVCVWMMCAFLLCYAMAVSSSHIRAFVPFISECGTIPPESCVYGQMLNIGAVLLAVLFYVRYEQVNIAINSKIIINTFKIWNEVALWFGIIACIGLSIVANFQPTIALWFHSFGGFLAFGGMIPYFTIYIKISASFYQIKHKYPEYGISKFVLYLRIFLTILYAILFGSFVLCFGKALSQFKGKSMIAWKQEDGGLEMRLASAISEWLLALIFGIYLLTTEKEFESIEFEAIRFKNKQPIRNHNVRKKQK